MFRPARALLASSLLCAAACASSPPASSPVAPGPPAASAQLDPPPPVVVEPESDPKIVRCGVDDRPRSVVSSLDLGPSERARRVPMKPAFEIAAPLQRGISVPPPVGGPVLPRVTAALDKPSVQFASMPDLDACEGLATVADEATFQFPVELSTEGAPLRVRPPAASVSPYVRCLQERLCGLGGGPQSKQLTVPVSVKWNYARRLSPRAAPDGQASAPRVTFERELPAAHARHAYARTLKALVHHAAAACGFPGAEVSLILTVTLDKRMKITGAKGEATGPELPQHMPTCVAERMKGEQLPAPPEPRPSGDVALVLDW